MPAFARYVGIDYSGAATPTTGLPGLRVYATSGGALPREVRPVPPARRHWTRRGVAEWLVTLLKESTPSLVGIDHSFCFPLPYFEKYRLAHDWPAFLDDFQRHWPTDGDQVKVESIRKGLLGNGAARSGDSRWRRLAEVRVRAKSVFHFDVQGQVAKSTHAGLPWLRYLRTQLGSRVHFWPYDGWEIPPGCSAIVEGYPALCSRQFAREERRADQHDAYSLAAWMAQIDRDGTLAALLRPALTPAERERAAIEGWVLGAPAGLM